MSPARNQVIGGCNYEDAVVVSKDTDVLILMNWVCSKLKVTYLQYNREKFADIRKIRTYLGKTLSWNLTKI